MWVNKSELKRLIHEAIHFGKDYPTTIMKMKKELEELKLQKTMEEREIKHLVTLKEAKLDVENEKKVVTLQAQFQEKEMKLQREYHTKVMTQIDAARKEQKEVYSEIMKRLPNITAALEIKKRG